MAEDSPTLGVFSGGVAAGPDGFMVQMGLYWVYESNWVSGMLDTWKLKSYYLITNECNLPFLSWSSTGEKWRVAEVTSPSVPPKPQETLAVQLRSANSKVSKATNERKAAAKRAAQQVGSVDPCHLYILPTAKKTRDIYWKSVRFVFLFFFMWIID